jgi:hypothetical protein
MPNSPHGKDSEDMYEQSNSRKGLTKSVAVSMGQSGPVRTSQVPAAQVGPYSVMQHTREES